MATVLFCALFLAAPPDVNGAGVNGSPGDGGHLAAPDHDPTVPRSPRELREFARSALRQSRGSGVSNASAVERLCAAHDELMADKGLSNTEREELKQLVRSRLLDLGDRIAMQWQRAQREMEKQAAQKKRAGDRNHGEKGEPGAGDPSGQRPGDDSLASRSPQPGAPGGRGEEDNAEDLIDLIRTTIAPESWDVVGGQGSIYYYRNFKALVIRQTSEVHWLIGGLRKQLEK